MLIAVPKEWDQFMIQFFIIQKLILIYGILNISNMGKNISNLIIRKRIPMGEYGQQTTSLPLELDTVRRGRYGEDLM